MTFLLDVNVLIALIDPRHVNHDTAHRWFDETGRSSWASCPLTQNGVLRIVGHVRHANTPGSPAAVMPALASLCSLAGHVFWSDDVTMLDDTIVFRDKLLLSDQLTDCYLLALAVRHGGSLATFDGRIAADAVRTGKRALHVIPSREKRPQ